MRGPLLKGYAEMAIWKVDAAETSSSLQPPSDSTGAALANGNGHSKTLTPPTVTRHKQVNRCSPELRHILKLDSSSENSTTTTTTTDQISHGTRTSTDFSKDQSSKELQEHVEIPRHILPLPGQIPDTMNDNSSIEESGYRDNGDDSARNTSIASAMRTNAELPNSSSAYQVSSDVSANLQADVTDYPEQKHDRGKKEKSKIGGSSL